MYILMESEYTFTVLVETRIYFCGNRWYVQQNFCLTKYVLKIVLCVILHSKFLLYFQICLKIVVVICCILLPETPPRPAAAELGRLP
jgi:hypothetical protein